MEKYSFKLSPAYSLYNGAAVLAQYGARIWFLIENPCDRGLKKRLKTAFCKYISYVASQSDCPGNFRSRPVIIFEEGSRSQLKEIVANCEVEQ